MNVTIEKRLKRLLIIRNFLGFLGFCFFILSLGVIGGVERCTLEPVYIFFSFVLFALTYFLMYCVTKIDNKRKYLLTKYSIEYERSR